MPVRKPQICIGCARPHMIETNEPYTALTIFAQTGGMGKQRTSKSERLYLCAQSAVVTAMAGAPSFKVHPMEYAGYRTLRNLVGRAPDVSEVAFRTLAEEVMAEENQPLPEPEILPPAKRLAS